MFTAQTDVFNYVWACDDTLESYCCHRNSDDLGQKDCCNHTTRFSLDAPGAEISGTLTSSGASTATSTHGVTSSVASAAGAAGGSASSSSSSGGLSSGAKIGLGVGIPVR